MDEASEPHGPGPEGSGLFLAEPVLARSPAAPTVRRPRAAPLVMPAPDAALAATPVLPAPVVPPPSAVPPTLAEYFAAAEARHISAHQAFDPTRVMKGPTVVVARRRRRRRGPVVLGIAAVAAGATLTAFTLLSGDDPASAPGSTVSEASAGADPLPATADARSGSLGDLDVEVVSVTDPFVYSLGPAPEGFRYVAVEVRLAYDGSDVVEVPAAEALAVRDSRGRRWTLAEAPVDGLDAPFSELAPGLEASSRPVFVVADDASELSLVVTLSGVSGELALPLG